MGPDPRVEKLFFFLELSPPSSCTAPVVTDGVPCSGAASQAVFREEDIHHVLPSVRRSCVSHHFKPTALFVQVRRIQMKSLKTGRHVVGCYDIILNSSAFDGFGVLTAEHGRMVSNIRSVDPPAFFPSSLFFSRSSGDFSYRVRKTGSQSSHFSKQRQNTEFWKNKHNLSKSTQSGRHKAP